ncbi:MAG: diphthine synthase [Candidatus Micrarchaeota archaeon]|nr:diphthine synthase [Candidatus Micrarchaeota archaeon]
MLSIIGLGYSVDPTLKGLGIIAKSREIYLDSYTSPVSRNLKDLVEKAIGKEVKLAERKFIEEGGLVREAGKGDVALLVIGDPFFATTHVSMIIEAKQKGIKTEVISNSSIFDAVGRTGLSPYKFGRTVTLSYWREKYRPTSPLELIEKNRGIGLHTLVLLDVAEDLGPMDAKTGISQIREMEKAIGKEIISELFVISRAGFDDERITFGNIDRLEKESLGKPLFCFIVPGEMTKIEKEFAKAMAKKID